MSADWLQMVFLGSEVRVYVIAAVTLVGGLLLVMLLDRLAINRIQRWTRRTETDLDDRLVRLIDKHVVWLLYLGVFYLSIQDIRQAEDFPKVLGDVVSVLCLSLGTLLAVRLLGALVEYFVRLYWVTKHGDAMLEQSLRALVPAIKIVVWAVGVVFLLDNLGFDITAALASLGIGGVAIALASQGVLADLFSYFAILLDRPFEIGDFIITGNIIGTVESVGIKTTRIRSLGGEEMIVANTDITNSRIQNYKRMYRRRIAFHLGVTYETSLDQLMLIPDLIQQAVEKTRDATFDRAHFLSYGDFSLDFEVVYWVETGDYNAYMDAQQTINLSIKQAFKRENIDFAYPTQVIYANQTAPVGGQNGHKQESPQESYR
ncbi:mechanosensitive ion channel protein MscS [filamentous cyanobacterium CCP5]|nr:mechanosensitive ion channel protein MscS [filamentous cyanobacterium CCP5]